VKKLETRNLKGCELRADSENGFCIAGVAARYNIKAKIGGQFTEQIQRGAFARSLKNKSDVFATFNHSEDHLLGRTTSGTLTLQDAPDGLHFRCQLDKESQAHRDVYASVKRGDLNACSFSFVVPPNGDTWSGNERTLTNVDLREIAVVVSPAYSGTSVDARKKNKEDEPDDDNEPDDDDSDEEDEDLLDCRCACARCADGHCEECADENCEDENCDKCPQQPPDDEELADIRERLDAAKIYLNAGHAQNSARKGQQ